jgi:nucleoid DNA-binding protein
MNWPDWYFTDVPRNQLIKDLMKKFKLTKKKADDIIDTWGKYKEQRMSTGELEDFIHMSINEDFKEGK